jgi:hypothetical protein
VWVFALKDDLSGLISMAAGRGKPPSMAVLVPLLIMAVTFFGTIASLSGGRRAAPRKRIDHPMPPVDKPFEL